MFEGEVLVVGSRGAGGEGGPARWMGGQQDHGLGHGGGIAYGGVEAAVGVAYDLGHSTYVCDQCGEAHGHGLKERHGQPLRDGGHGVDIGGGEEVGDVEALSPERNVIGDAELVDERFERFAHDSVADDPELKVGYGWKREGGCFDHGGEIFDLGEAANEEEGEAVLLGVVLRRGGWEPVDTVVDAGDAVAPGERGVAQILAGDVADSYDPVAEEGDEAVGDLGRGFVGRGDEAVTGGDDAFDTGEAGTDGGLQGWCRVVAVDDVWPGATELAQEAHEGAGEGSFAKDVDADALGTQDFAECSKIAVGADGHIVPVGALQAAELGDEYLRTTHFETVDDVNDLHGETMALFPATGRWLERLMTNLHRLMTNLHQRSPSANPRDCEAGYSCCGTSLVLIGVANFS
ncbi:MAG: hypothetical protein JWP98_296 [Edaphobacter sp.]|nr:hypothetical protein [Edaphobacter sp.]